MMSVRGMYAHQFLAVAPVSYTHLDVYKRQHTHNPFVSNLLSFLQVSHVISSNKYTANRFIFTSLAKFSIPSNVSNDSFEVIVTHQKLIYNIT